MNTLSNFDSINLESLDEWLENDLRQAGIVLAADDKTPPSIVTPAQILMASPPISECTPNMGPSSIEASTPLIKYEPLSPIETPKITPQDMTKNNTASIDLQPFIKALSLLGSMQQQQQQQVSNPMKNTNKRERTEEPLSQEDIIALKRQRNTDAARRSRLRKALKMESLEKRVMDLEAENEQLRLKAAVVESDRANIEAKEKSSRVRILELEKQLADTHKVLLFYKDSAMKAVKV